MTRDDWYGDGGQGMIGMTGMTRDDWDNKG